MAASKQKVLFVIALPVKTSREGSEYPAVMYIHSSWTFCMIYSPICIVCVCIHLYTPLNAPISIAGLL